MFVELVILARRSCWWIPFARSNCRGEVRRQRVILDYLDCRGTRFANCELVYAGSASLNLTGCTMDGCSFNFVGAAASTVMLLKGIDRSGSREIIDRLFRGISNR